MVSHACVAVVVAVALGGLVPGSARATPAVETIAVLPLSITGELPPTSRDQLQSRLIEGMARGHRPVLAVEAGATCDAGCMRELGRTTGARWVARGRVSVRDRDFDVAIELFDARSGVSVTESADICELCAIDEVGDMLADQTGVLDSELDALSRTPPVIRFESRPAGALVWLDGVLVGPTPVERTVEEGRHLARAELDDHLPQEVPFEAVAGTRESIALELTRVPKQRRRMQQAGWGLFGAGLAVIGAGIPIVLLHGRPYQRRCTGRDVDADGDCRFVYGTLTGGAVTIAIGAAAAITGTVLVAIATRRGLPPRKRSARVRPHLHGLGIAF